MDPPAPAALELGDLDALERALVPEAHGGAAPEGLPLPRSWRERIADNARRVADDPSAWAQESAAWVPRIMFLMVPLYALLLGAVYVWRRGFFLFDHLIVSMHFHSALFLAMVFGSLAAVIVGWGWVIPALFVYANLYLYRLHRRVYARGRFSALVRVLVLDLAYGLLLAAAMGVVVLLGFLSL